MRSLVTAVICTLAVLFEANLPAGLCRWATREYIDITVPKRSTVVS